MASTARAVASKKKRKPLKKQPPARKPPAVKMEDAGVVLLSISQIAAEFGRDRATVAKRIAEIGIEPAGTRRGYPVYRLKGVIEIERKAPNGEVDPEKLSVFDRNIFYKGESERLRVEEARGTLMQRDQVETEWARVLKVVTLGLETLPDEIERDVGVSPLVLEKIEEKIDAIREEMYRGVVELGELREGDHAAAPVP